MKLAELAALENEYKKSAYRVSFRLGEGIPGDPGHEAARDYLPDTTEPGVTMREAERLARRLARVAPMRDYQDIQIVGPDLKPATTFSVMATQAASAPTLKGEGEETTLDRFARLSIKARRKAGQIEGLDPELLANPEALESLEVD